MRDFKDMLRGSQFLRYGVDKSNFSSRIKLDMQGNRYYQAECVT